MQDRSLMRCCPGDEGSWPSRRSAETGLDSQRIRRKAVLGGLIEALPALSPGELDQVLGMNALRTYQLDRSSAVAPG